MIIFHSGNLPHHGLDRVFEIAKKSGFEGIEIMVTNNFDTYNSEYLKMLEKRHNLPIQAFSLSQNYEESLIRSFQETVREFPKTKIIMASPAKFSNKYGAWLKKIAPALAKKYKLEYLRRNVSDKNIMGLIPYRVDNSLYALKGITGVCLDTSALGSGNEDIIKGISVLGEKLRHVYLSNINESLPYSPPEKGVLPLESFLAKLFQVGYDGDFTLIVNASKLKEGDDETLIYQFQQSQKFISDYFER